MTSPPSSEADPALPLPPAGPGAGSDGRPLMVDLQLSNFEKLCQAVLPREPEKLIRLCLRRLPLPGDADFRVLGDVLEIRHELPFQEVTSDIMEKYSDAHQRAQADDFAGVLAVLRELLAINPYFEDARMLLFDCVSKLHGTAEKLDEVIEALRLDPENGNYHAIAAMELGSQDESSPAVRAYFSQAVRLDTHIPYASFALGHMALLENHHDEALDHFARVPDEFVGRVLRRVGAAMVHGERDDFHGVLDEMKKCFAEPEITMAPAAVRETASHLFTCACANLEFESREERMRVALWELDAVERDLGWAVELVAEEANEDGLASGDWLRWQSLDRPGTVILAAPEGVLDDADWLLARIREIHMESLPRGKSGLRHLRRLARKIANGVVRRPAPEHWDPTVDAPRETELDLMMEATAELCAWEVFRPLEWHFIRQIAARHPGFYPACVVFIHRNHLDPPDDEVDAAMAEFLDPCAIDAMAAMVGAQTLFLLDLTGHAADVTGPHQSRRSWPRSLAVFDHWRNRMDSGLRPGEEADLMRECATLAGFLPDVRVPVQGRLLL